MSRPSRPLHAATRLLQRAGIVLLAASAVLIAPATASAGPTLQSPTANASVTEGKTVTYSWTGGLQGANGTLDQSYFKIEVIALSKVPSGQQAAWDPDTFKQTDPGQAVTSIDLGAPPAGSWKWRVCAWGVVDPNVSVTVQQIPNGCSASRALTSVTVLADNKEVQVIEETVNVKVTSAPTVIERVRPATPKAAPVADEAPNPTVPKDELPVADPVEPIKIESAAEEEFTTADGESKSSVALSSSGGIGDAGEADKTAARGGGAADISGALATGLGATIPGIPVPFWVLAFILACIPIAIIWRRSVLAMFEWSDGSIDGFGTPDKHAVLALAKIQPDHGSHAFGGAADVAAMSSMTNTKATASRPAA